MSIFQYWFLHQALNYNLGQNILDKLTQLGKIHFSGECFTVGFFHFAISNITVFILGYRLGGKRFPFQAFRVLSRNFLISKSIKSQVIRQVVIQLVYSLYGDNNLMTFHLPWRETFVEKPTNIWFKIVAKHQNNQRIFSLLG